MQAPIAPADLNDTLIDVLLLVEPNPVNPNGSAPPGDAPRGMTGRVSPGRQAFVKTNAQVCNCVVVRSGSSALDKLIRVRPSGETRPGAGSLLELIRQRPQTTRA